MTTTPKRLQITPAQKRVAHHVVRGASNAEICAQLHLSESTVRSHIKKGSKILGCPTRSSRAVYVHALLTHQQVLPPPAPRPGTQLTEPEQKILRAVAEHSRIDEIATAAGIHRDDVRLEITALRDKTGAVDDAHLVSIGHSLGNLAPAQNDASTDSPAEGADR
ncbi:LuxR C-terminal-related transcriptional regulator [Streptomyces sp. NPDC059949]|uniref:LuxR C-terminal-related transcriptional regulator n=1 Tax=Streptomyces sp. NPDC059949 TaxID=3347013 RepID=UPI00365040FE